MGTVLAIVLAAMVGSSAVPASVDVEAPGPRGPLRGTLTDEAAVRRAVVLILPGSGPTDRDGNSPLGILAAPYRLLAEGLAARGVATVRIDKRGMFGSAGAVPDANAVTIGDYVDDVRSWIGAIRERTGARCVWLLGHSEGGLVALATVARSNADICGLVLVATPGRPPGDVLKAQLAGNPANAPLLAAGNHAIDELAAGHRVDAATLPASLQPLFPARVQGFLQSEFALDPVKLLGGLRTARVHIVQGARDLQVSVQDAHQLAEADPAATLLVLPDVNHVLKVVETDGQAANAATYARSDLPLAPGVADAIARFVTAPGR